MKKRKVDEIAPTEEEKETIKVDKEYYDKLIQGHVNLLKKLTSQIDQMEHDYLLRM